MEIRVRNHTQIDFTPILGEIGAEEQKYCGSRRYKEPEIVAVRRPPWALTRFF